MSEDFKGQAFRQFVFFYWLAIITCVGLGIYYLFAGKSTGGQIVSRYTGNTTSIQYDGCGFFIIGGLLLLGGALFYLASHSKKRKHNGLNNNS